jgi:putative hydrolase of HD superfamily
MCDSDRLSAILAFVRAAEPLKDTLRSARTAQGRTESTAEHSWRLCLLALALEEEMEGVDLLQLLRLCILHDLGEALTGDVPATRQGGGDDREAAERAAIGTLCNALPPDRAARMRALWEEYAAGETPEAAMAKGLDKIETILQHAAGQNPPEFDYAFNLDYGRNRTDRTALLRRLRDSADALTRARMADR